MVNTGKLKRTRKKKEPELCKELHEFGKKKEMKNKRREFDRCFSLRNRR